MATALVGDEPRAAELAARLRLVIARTARRLRQEAGADRGGRPGAPADRRVSLVSASRRGAALLRRMQGRKNAYLARRLRGLERDELRTLERAADILERLLEGEA